MVQDAITLIDVVLTKNASKVLKTIVANISLSDHEIAGVIRRMHFVKYKPRKIRYRDCSRSNMKALKFDLMQLQIVPN